MSSTPDLTITHTPAEGTLIEGTSRGDGTAEILKANRWRWGRSIGAWYIPRSRDGSPKMPQIEATQRALQDAGWSVELEIDDSYRSTAQVEQDLAVRQAERAAALASKASQARAREAQAWAAEESASAAVPPMGEPVKMGHHSAGRHLRSIERARSAMDKAVQAKEQAREAERRHAEAVAASGARYAPVTVANRIESLGAEHRRLSRFLGRLADPTGKDAERWRAERERIADQLAYWKTVRAAQVEEGLATDYGPDQVKAGDQVQLRGSWYTVVRANPKTVTLRTDTGKGRAPYSHLQGHRPARKS